MSINKNKSERFIWTRELKELLIKYVENFKEKYYNQNIAWKKIKDDENKFKCSVDALRAMYSFIKNNKNK